MQSSKYFNLINMSRLQMRNRNPVLNTIRFFAIYWRIFFALYRIIMLGYTLADLEVLTTILMKNQIVWYTTWWSLVISTVRTALKNDELPKRRLFANIHSVTSRARKLIPWIHNKGSISP